MQPTTPKTLLGKEADFILPKLIWFGLGLTAALLEVLRNDVNNYAIYKGACLHLFKELPLYDAYPLEYFDSNHYGPLFGFLFTPFAILPEQMAVMLWCLFNIWVLYFAIRNLNLGYKNEALIFCFGSIELMTSIHNLQINPLVTALIIFSYIAYKKDHVILAAFLVSIGFLIKLYGIVGLVFLVFSKRKISGALYFILITALLVAVPALFVSGQYLLQQYYGWYLSLVDKHGSNLQSNMQNISLQGFLQTVFQLNSTIIALIAGLFAMATLSPLLRFKLYRNRQFQLSILALFLITVVVLSSSAESSTYIIAITGVCLYAVLYKESRVTLALAAFAFLFTSLASTDLVPASLKLSLVRPYKLKALPCILILIDLIRRLLKDNQFNELVSL